MSRVASVPVSVAAFPRLRAELIEADNAGDAYTPQVVVHAAGEALAVWGQNDGTQVNIYANRYQPGTGWGSAIAIDSASGDAAAPQIAVDVEGDAIAAEEVIGQIAVEKPGRDQEIDRFLAEVGSGRG